MSILTNLTFFSAFSFLPRWRLDDLMVSVAASGSVAVNAALVGNVIVNDIVNM